jgi:hypothetical protein
MPSSQNDIGVFGNTVTPRFLGFTQVSIAAGPAFTKLPPVPPGVDFLIIQPTDDVRFLDDGINNASQTRGIKIPKDVPFQYQVSDFTLITFCPDSAVIGAMTLNVVGYSYATRKEV